MRWSLEFGDNTEEARFWVLKLFVRESPILRI